MSSIKVLPFLLFIGFIACQHPLKKNANKLEIAEQYYKMLNKSDQAKLTSIIGDSLLTKETEFDYKQTFLLDEYKDWLAWDSIFEPQYEILQMEQIADEVHTKVAKIDKRILFLHGEPIISKQVILFDQDKISSIETREYLVFKDSLFVKNRDTFVNWIEANHPELGSFLHEQTKSGGLNYLKAIEFYENRP